MTVHMDIIPSYVTYSHELISKLHNPVVFPKKQTFRFFVIEHDVLNHPFFEGVEYVELEYAPKEEP